MRALGGIPRSFIGIGAIAFFWSANVLAGPTAAPGDDMLGGQLERRLPYEKVIGIAPGETVWIDVEKTIPAQRLRKKAGDFEGIVTGIVAPDGIVIHRTLDSFEIQKTGANVLVKMTYVVHSEVGERGAGAARLESNLVERAGLANTLVKVKLDHTIQVSAFATSDEKLKAAFEGYRHFRGKATKGKDELKKRGLTLSMSDSSAPPALDRADARTAAAVQAFIRYRTRLWAAHRHMLAAKESSDPKLQRIATTYLQNLSTPDAELGAKLKDLAPSQAKEDAIVETAPTPATGTPKPGAGDVVAPVATYEPGSEREVADATMQPPTPAATPAPEPTKKEFLSGPRSGGQDILSEDLLAKQLTIPGYPRALTLDDPNIGYGASVRATYANVSLGRETAFAPSLFFSAQAAVTKEVGVELVVPTAYVDIERHSSVFALGNPLISGKVRFHLPKIEGRAPVLTLRGRWAIALSGQHAIPPTRLSSEEFSFPANTADPYAFLLEKTGLGLGANSAWQHGIWHLSAQLYGDVFIPVEKAFDQVTFYVLSYGASVGALPWGDLLGFYLETRATSFFNGPTRTELFAYLGARAHLEEFLEPALYAAIPIGSVSDVTSFLVGIDLRIAFDVDDFIVVGGKNERRTPELLQ